MGTKHKVDAFIAILQMDNEDLSFLMAGSVCNKCIAKNDCDKNKKEDMSCKEFLKQWLDEDNTNESC